MVWHKFSIGWIKMNNKDNFKGYQNNKIHYMYEFWLILPHYCTQIVAICSQMHISIDSNTKFKIKDQKMKQLDAIITWNNVMIHKNPVKNHTQKIIFFLFWTTFWRNVIFVTLFFFIEMLNHPNSHWRNHINVFTEQYHSNNIFI